MTNLQKLLSEEQEKKLDEILLDFCVEDNCTEQKDHSILKRVVKERLLSLLYSNNRRVLEAVAEMIDEHYSIKALEAASKNQYAIDSGYEDALSDIKSFLLKELESEENCNPVGACWGLKTGERGYCDKHKPIEQR